MVASALLTSWNHAMGMLFCLVMGASLASLAGDPVAPDASYLYQPSFSMDYALRQPAVPYVPQPGDIFLSTGCEMWAKLGHWAAGAEAPQHSGIMVALPNGRMGLLEAGPRNTVQCSILDPVPEMQWYTQKERVWIRRRRVPLTPEQSTQLTNLALAVNGKPFGLVRMLGQLTPLRPRNSLWVQHVGSPRGAERYSYFCSELVTEGCVAAGLLDPCTTRPAATYPRDLFLGQSRNTFINSHLDMSAWDPPARWTSCPGSEPSYSRHHSFLDGDTH